MPAIAGKIGRAVEAEARCKQRVFGAAQMLGHLPRCPHIERAFAALAVRVQAGGKTAVGEQHLALQPFNQAFTDVDKIIALPAPRRARIQAEQQGIVAEHLLEMRNLPDRIHAVAKKAAAEMIVQTQAGHGIKRVADDLGSGLIIQIHQCSQQRGLREFRPAAEAAVFLIKAGAGLSQQGFTGGGQIARSAGCRTGNGLQRFVNLQMLVSELVTTISPDPMNALQKITKADHALTRFGREIGAGEKWRLTEWIKKHGQWPAAAPTVEKLVGELINAVQIRALL